MIKGVIFDLDGVLTSTSKNHYKCWKYIADDLNIDLNEKINENLKGVSRVNSLKYILKSGNVKVDKIEFNNLLDKKTLYFLKV